MSFRIYKIYVYFVVLCVILQVEFDVIFVYFFFCLESFIFIYFYVKIEIRLGVEYMIDSIFQLCIVYVNFVNDKKIYYID